MRVIGLLILACEIAWAQPTFEVASVKPLLIPPGAVSRSGPSRIIISGKRVTSGGNLLSLVAAAYNLQTYQVSAGAVDPALGSLPYSIEARASGDGVPTQEEVRQMLQKLLADRFRMTFHRAPKEMAVYTLTVGKNRSMLKPGTPGEKSDSALTPHASGLAEAKFTNFSMSEFARVVASQFDRPLLDKTGLTGGYDFTLEFSLRPPQIPGAERAAFDAGLPIIAGIQEQIGLKVTPSKEMVEILVIDHAEKASDN